MDWDADGSMPASSPMCRGIKYTPSNSNPDWLHLRHFVYQVLLFWAASAQPSWNEHRHWLEHYSVLFIAYRPYAYSVPTNQGPADGGGIKYPGRLRTFRCCPEPHWGQTKLFRVKILETVFRRKFTSGILFRTISCLKHFRYHPSLAVLAWLAWPFLVTPRFWPK